MNMIIALSLILLLLLVLIGKTRGVKAFCSLFINYTLIVIMIRLICLGAHPVITAFLFSLGASAFILFFLNGVNIKTRAAYISVVFVMLINAFLMIFVVYRSGLNGFSPENGAIVYILGNDINVNYYHVEIAIILIALTGAVTDTALDIATSLNEVRENNQDLSFVELWKSGKRMGGDILGTMINTIFFVFLGEFIGFFVYRFSIMQNQNFQTIINSKYFNQEISRLLICNLGCTLIIPITIAVLIFGYSRRKIREVGQIPDIIDGIDDIDDFD